MPPRRSYGTLLIALALVATGLVMVVLLARMATPDDRRIAITFDDLPWASLGDRPSDEPPQPGMMQYHRQLMAALRESGAPATGFINEDKLEVDGLVNAERVQMLRDWLDAGSDLGNHTYAHSDLHKVGLAAYQADILKGERQLRPLLAERGRSPAWFRTPYLRAGRTLEDKEGLGDFLHEHGYRLAPATVDNSDWIWAEAYRNVIEDGGDVATLERLRTEYVFYMMAKVDYYERFSHELLGYNLPHIWLMHVNELNAVAYPAMIQGLHDRGYRIVSLDEAMKDPAYERADTHTGPWGPSWLHRWAWAEQKPPEFFAGDPVSPDWVLALAGVESE